MIMLNISNEGKPVISPWALLIAVIFFTVPILIRIYGIDLITDRMIKDEIWKLHFVTAVIFAYYLGIKGAIFVALFSGLASFFLETKLIMAYGKDFSIFIRHLSIEIVAILVFTITIGTMSEKLKDKQRKLTIAHEKLTQLAVLEERNNIAKDLHDGLAQSLGYMNLKLSTIESSLGDNNIENGRKHLDELHEIIDETYAEIKHHIFGLNYKFNSPEQFLLKINEFLQKYSKSSGINVKYNSTIKHHLELPLKVQLNLFRIIQEALANVRKHAGVSEVEVDFSKDKAALLIIIKDSGVGFDIKEVTQKTNNFGLSIMEQRADAIGALFSVTSQPEKGTCIQIIMPITDRRWLDES